jgi:hypothetical protein
VRWLQDDEDFRKKYALSRQQQAEVLAQQLIEIADDGSNDTYKTEDGQTVVNHDHINRSRLRIDVRKWIASKLLPKVYGEKGTEVNLTNAIHNHFHVSEEMLTRIQERRQQLLTGA